MTACVGRERELAWITARLEASSASGTGMVLVAGPPGVGKSRLLDELREQCRTGGFPVLEGWCVRHAAYAPFVAIAAQALAWLRTREEQDLLGPGDLEALAPLVHGRGPRARGDDVDEPPDDDESAIRFIEAVGRLLAAVGRLRPVLVLLRAYSRADDATRALARSLLDAAGPLGEPTPGAPAALLVAAGRPEDADGTDDAAEHPRTEQLALEGLGVDGVRRILADEAVITRLHAATSGNPESLLGMLERLPPPREAEVNARVGELGDVPRRIVATLAAAGRPLTVPVLAGSLGLDAQTVTRAVPALAGARMVWRALDPAAGDVVIGLARHDDGEAVLGAMAPAERAAVHRALGTSLESWGRAAPEEVVEHLLEGTDRTHAADDAVSVARTLLRRHAPASALAMLRRAAPHAGAGALRELARLAAAAAAPIGAHADARVLVAQAAEANPRDAELARLDAVLAMGVADWEGAVAALDRADGWTDTDDHRQRAANAATRAELSYQRGLLGETERLARAAIELGRDDDPLVTQARNTLTKVFLVRRELDQGWDWSLQSLERARARGSNTEILRGLINLGVVAIWRGDLAEATRQLDAARAVAQRGGSMMLRGVLRENEAVVAHLQGRFGDALQCYQEALGILTRVGNRRFLARVANNLGELYIQVGEVARARRLVDYAAQVARGLSGALAAEGLMLRAQVEIADARTDAARAALAEALALYAAAGDVERQASAHLLLARAAMADGDTVAVAEALAQVPEGGEEVSDRVAAERVRLETELARALGEDSLPTARRALELAEKVRDPDLRLRAHAATALALLDRGEEAPARKHAEAAEALRAELVAQVPEGLRVSYGAQLARAGIGALTARMEVLADRPAAVAKAAAPVPGAGAMGIVGESAAMRELRRRIARVAPQDVTVLLRGESGTGKERVAEALHRLSHRKDGPLVKVNCAALAEGVLLSELFGHEKGAFTGADRRRRGRFELADGGTIFLDEIGDVTPATQAALLRVLQERTFERVGGNETLRVDVRIITATNRDLAQMVKERAFREDLYFRLTSLTVQIPPLRDRTEDLAALSAYILDREARTSGLPLRRLSAAALRRLTEHAWPGNVRELENVLRSSALFTEEDDIQADGLQGLPEVARVSMTSPRPSMLPPAPGGGGGYGGTDGDEVQVVYAKIRSGGVSLFDMRRELEKGCIAHALEEARGNITRAAALLGMKRPRLSQLVREYGLAKGADPVENGDP